MIVNNSLVQSYLLKKTFTEYGCLCVATLIASLHTNVTYSQWVEIMIFNWQMEMKFNSDVNRASNFVFGIQQRVFDFYTVWI